ncbi:spore coat protein [Metabacillus malikii]|uniref:Spore coat protein CotF n=1 Tax=Metabacillus malikii TaxID=1504265 RepID=A0ABT9ZCJ1_9BACI|nr:spore coat protein [Metabacillus malikii]MDQ0229991.1 spore coat protein CotF [Metabacillus malikii]
MPNNIEGRGLTNREMLQLCLELEKGRCRSLATTIMETSHVKLQKIYMACYERALSNHNALYNILSENGWYKTIDASQAEIEEVQNTIQHNLNPRSE